MRVALLLLALIAAPLQADWFRGNTHTHTSESDGDSTPLEVAQWYADHGYHFLVLTDHDKLTRLENPPLLLIPGEEISDKLPKRPIHLGAIGIEKVIAPAGGSTVVEVLQRNVDAIVAGGGVAAINHPNFGWAFGTPELLQIRGATLLEIVSGHPYVNQLGPPSVEQMWDDLLTAGRRIWGVAADDSHHFKRPWDTHVALPGQAWIVVRAERGDRPSITEALRRGDFYASTGVEIADYQVKGDTLSVTITPRGGAHYRTLYIGEKGRVLAESTELSSTFKLGRKSSYVRAKVIDSNGNMAWLQPVFREKR